MLFKLVLNSWAQAILLPWPPKVLDSRREPLCPGLPLHFEPVITCLSCYFNYLTHLSLPLAPEGLKDRNYGLFMSISPNVSHGRCSTNIYRVESNGLCGVYTCANRLSFFSDNFILVSVCFQFK